MDSDQADFIAAVWPGFIVFASLIEFSLKCTWIYKYAADEQKWTFPGQKLAELWLNVKSYLKYY